MVLVDAKLLTSTDDEPMATLFAALGSATSVTTACPLSLGHMGQIQEHGAL